MSTSARQKVGVVVASALAIGLLGYAVTSERPGTDDAAAAATVTGTVAGQPTKAVDVVDLTTPAQAAIAVSNRLFRPPTSPS